MAAMLGNGFTCTVLARIVGGAIQAAEGIETANEVQGTVEKHQYDTGVRPITASRQPATGRRQVLRRPSAAPTSVCRSPRLVLRPRGASQPAHRRPASHRRPVNHGRPTTHERQATGRRVFLVRLSPRTSDPGCALIGMSEFLRTKQICDAIVSIMSYSSHRQNIANNAIITLIATNRHTNTH